MTDLLLLIASALWFFLAVSIANQSVGFARKLRLPLSKTPVWERRLGKGKTWGAYYAGPFGALSVLYMQRQFPEINAAIGLFDYEQSLLWPSLALGLGAVLGDHGKSLIKRWWDIAPGTKWFPDRIDYAIGAIAASACTLVWIGWGRTIIILVVAALIHPVGNRIGYHLGLRDVPW